MRFLAAHNVTGIFAEGAYDSPFADMAELKGFLLSRLLWDPSQNDTAIMGEFLELYYGPAAPFVRTYLQTMRDSVATTRFFMTEAFDAQAPFLTPSAVLR